MKTLNRVTRFISAYFTSLQAIRRHEEITMDYDLYHAQPLEVQYYDYLHYCQCKNKKPVSFLVWRLTDKLHTKFWTHVEAAKTAWCETVGHHYEDHSYGGPDGGCIDIHCVRCGHGWHTTLY